MIKAPEEENRENWGEVLFIDVVTENFPELMKYTNLQIQEAQYIPHRKREVER